MSDATADAAGDDQEPKKKSSKMPLIIGLVLAVLGGGGGFYAASSGLLPFGGAHEAAVEGGHGAPADGHGTGAPLEPLGNVAFLELPTLVASLGSVNDMHHLRFQANLEVDKTYLADVELLQPRILDVLNSYLRALEPRDIESPGALIKLRSQMLRRIQLVAGEGRVRDLLVAEFVLN